VAVGENAAGRKRKLAPGIAFKIAKKQPQRARQTREGSRPRDPLLANRRPTGCRRGYTVSAIDRKGREIATSMDHNVIVCNALWIRYYNGMDEGSNNTLPSRRAPPHLAIVDRGNRPNIIYLTVCTWNREPILASHPMHDLLIEMWEKAHTWLVGHFVILPDHIHLFCAPAEVVYPPLTVWASYWKRLTTIARRQTHPGFRWQVNFWDTQLRSGDSYDAKWAYVYENPVRHGLVQKAEEWPFSGRLHDFTWTSD
jgi:putative transposase